MQHDLVLTHGDITLRPLDISDAPTLFALVDADMWKGMSPPVPGSVEDMEEGIRSLISMDHAYAFAVEYHGKVVGRTMFFDYTPALRVMIGYTFYGRDYWGTAVNPTAKYLLLRHAFEEFGVERVALRCDTRNKHSWAAIEKLGCTYEGTSRRFRRAADGGMADVANFSIIKDEWPRVKEALQKRI